MRIFPSIDGVMSRNVDGKLRIVSHKTCNRDVICLAEIDQCLA